MLKKENEKKVSGDRQRGTHYEKSFKRAVVKEVEEGLSRGGAVRKYGVSLSSLDSWLRQYGSSSYHSGKKQRFSMQQKRSIVRQISQGLMTVSEARTKYGIKGDDTVRKWLRESMSEKSELRGPNRIVMEDQSKQEGQAGNAEELKRLQQQLEEAQLKIQALETLVDVAEDMFKIEIRKKAGARQSGK